MRPGPGKSFMNQSLVTQMPVSDRVREALAVTLRRANELIPEEDWLKKLVKSEASGVPLRIKLGLDPTAPDIHIGHTVVLTKLRRLQGRGHRVFFRRADFTPLMGDPPGRTSTRPRPAAGQTRPMHKPTTSRPASCWT